MSKLSIGGYPQGVLTDIESALVDLNTLLGYCVEIDGAATDGLLGVADSLAYRAAEVERHLHSYERWFGLAAVPVGETHVADGVLANPSPFRIDAGNDTWGAWVQVLGSTDTPVNVGDAYFDLHRVEIVGVETANVTYFIQVASGESGAAALAAGTYTEFVFRPQSANGRPAPVEMQDRRVAVGTKVWMRNLAKGENTAYLDLYVGVHSYEG